MKLKKLIYINTLGTFLLCFFTHFLYTWFPNPVFALFFPVNESIWEHMKMLYTSILLFGLTEFIIIQKSQIENHNFLLSLFLKSLCSIPVFLIVYLPFYYFIGEHMAITFILLLLVLFFLSWIGYKLQNMREIKYQNGIAFTGIIVGYIILGYLTYRPPHIHLFLDTKEEKYGIHEYLLD